MKKFHPKGLCGIYIASSKINEYIWKIFIQRVLEEKVTKGGEGEEGVEKYKLWNFFIQKMLKEKVTKGGEGESDEKYKLSMKDFKGKGDERHKWHVKNNEKYKGL